MNHGWRRKLLWSWSLLSGLLGALSFAPFNYWPFALVSMAGLMQAVLYAYRLQQAVSYGFCWGLGFFGLGVYWIAVSLHNFGSLSWSGASLVTGALVGYLALYPSLAAGGWYLLLSHPSKGVLQYSLGAAVIWQLTELGRATLFTGFPWLSWGYGQITSPFSGIAPLGGVEAVTFCLVWSVALILAYQQTRSSSGIRLLLGLGLLVGWAKGCQDSWTAAEPSRTLSVSLIQGNQPQSLKWSEKALTAALQTYERLSSHSGSTQLLVWPEAALPGVDQQLSLELSKLSKKYAQQGITLLTGILLAGRHTNEYFNGIRLLGACGGGEQFYVKKHLVPFGEYLPGPQWFVSLIEGWKLPIPQLQSKPIGDNVLIVRNYRFLPSICYEVAFGEALRTRFAEEVDCLVTLSNDSWFLNTVGPWQHHEIAQMRALELGRPLLRSTNNGITSVVDHLGQVRHALPQFQEGMLTATVTPRRGLTPYAKWGNAWLLYLTCIGFTGYLWRWWKPAHIHGRCRLWKR